MRGYVAGQGDGRRETGLHRRRLGKVVILAGDSHAATEHLRRAIGVLEKVGHASG